MNIEDYISSGIIETYALGLAPDEEARELEKLCLQYPEIQAAVREAELALEDYAQLNAITPPEDVKEQIWSAINVDSQNEAEPISKQKTPESPKGIYKLYPVIAKAAILLIIIGIPYHIYKMNQYESEISTLEREKSEILVQNQIFNVQIKEVSRELDILTDPSTRNILLAGVEGYEDNKATVYWSGSGEIFISPGLDPLPQDRQYQLWAIVDGKPVSAGLLEQDGTIRLQKMATIERAEMFAITIEKLGGSEQPTLDQMVVAGKALS